MKTVAAMEVILRVAKSSCCMMWVVTGFLRAESESLPYHFIRFEENEGYQVGGITGANGGLRLLQGDARIVRDKADEAGQCLETVPGNPFTSLHFHGERVSRNHKTYYEVWVRPSASPMAKSEEFMDFDGAVIGFFANEPDQTATFYAYHALPENQGYWVSTGVSASVGPAGMAQEWIRISICQDLEIGTWDLEIGGEEAMTEIRPTERPSADGIQLWMLGHEALANRFDDLLISPVEPDSLRLGAPKHFPPDRSAEPGHAGKLDRTGQRKVSRKQSDEDRRRHDAGIAEGVAKSAPKSFDFAIDIIEGGNQHGKSDGKDSDAFQKYLIYSPKYDDAGNPLPLKLRIQCDAELVEGADLSKILWAVTENTTEKDQQKKVIAHGTFKTGFTQIAEIPSEWANKATQIHVGTNLVLKSSP